jgi:uncharacterized protein (UPF0332 family)
MDQAEESRRWDATRELYQAADAALKQGRYRATAASAYYACYQAMWVALGDPPLGEWRHLGITRHFCSGQWVDPPLDPRSLAALYKRLLALYELRLDAHYRAVPVNHQQAQQGVDTAAEVIRLIQQQEGKRGKEGS